MTEDTRKIQLGASFDASGVKEGFDQLKNIARDMAQVVTQAGQTASKGLDGIADGAKRAADGFTRSEGTMRASIQRSTLELQNLGKTLSQKFEAKIDFKGFDPTKFANDIAALKEAEQAIARAQASAAGASFVSGLQSQIAQMREQQQLAKLTADEALRYKAALLGAGAAAEPLIVELTQLKGVQEAAAKAALAEAAAQKEAQAAIARRTGFVDTVKGQANAVGKSRADLLAEQAAQLGVTKELTPYIAKIREADQANKGLAASGKLTAFQTQQLGFQLHDFGVQVLSGQNALTAFVQQGSQLSGTFGGAGNALRAVASAITPMTVAIGAAVVGVGALALALAHAETNARSLNTLQAQLSGTGRTSLFSAKDLQDYIAELSKAPGVTRENATAIVSEFSKVHQIGGDLFKDLGRIVADWAKATGQSTDAAAKDVAKMFSEPIGGAKRLEEATGKLSSAQLAAIQNAVKFGDSQRALKILMEATASAVEGTAARGVTPLQGSIKELTNAWDKAMDTFGKSEGLKTVNSYLAQAIVLVGTLIEQSDKLGGLGPLFQSLIPGQAPNALGRGAGEAIRQGAESVVAPFRTPNLSRREASGKVTDAASGAAVPGVPGGTTGPTDADIKLRDDFIKKQAEIAEGHRSEAQELADLKLRREQFNKALSDSIDLYGKDGAKAKSATEREGAKLVQDQLRGGITATDKDIREQIKRSAAEGQTVLDARLQGQIKAAQDALGRERETIAFQQRFLAGEYQAGEVSLVEFFDKKRKAISDGIAAEIAELDKERVAVQAHLDKTVDKGKREQDEQRLGEIGRKQADLRTQADRDTQLANQEQTASFKQLSDQVTEYRANLLQLVGDEAGASRLREQIAARQDVLLQTKARKSGIDIPDSVLQQAADFRQQGRVLDAARKGTGIVTQGLGLEEQRIADAQRRGSISELEALAQLGEARKRVIPQLEAIVEEQEKIAANFQNKDNWELQIEVARARQDLERFKTEALDPLAEHFRTMFKDAGSNLFTDLARGKNPLDSLKRAGQQVFEQLTAEGGRSLSEKVFGKDGPLGGLGDAFAEAFGGKKQTAPKPLVDTSGVVTSLRAMQQQGVDPVTASLRSMEEAVDANAEALRRAAGAPPTPGDFARQDRGQGVPLPTTGDFSRLDRGQEPASLPTTGDFTRLDRQSDSGERQVMDLFKDAKRSSDVLAASNVDAAQTVLQLAGAASRGNDALSLLPYIIRLIQAAASSAGGEVGNYAKAAGSLFGGNVSGAQASFSQTSIGSSGFGTGLAYGNQDYGLFLHDGGLVGKDEMERPMSGLKANEVPAILMGGPKGVREEVLTADDPRHSDNLNPKLKKLIDRMPRYHEGGVVGDKSYVVSASTAMVPSAQPIQETASAGSGQVVHKHYHLAVHAAPGMTRQAASQLATDGMRALKRGEKNL